MRIRTDWLTSFWGLFSCSFIFTVVKAADWCFVCDTLKDHKCADPVVNFVNKPAWLIGNTTSQKIFAFTADSGYDEQQTTMTLVDQTKYCVTKTGTSPVDAAMNYCDYRPKGLRLVNCKMLLNTAVNPQCQKITQTVSTQGKQTMSNIVRMCVGGDGRGALNTDCLTQTSNDGLTYTTTCTCNDNACNNSPRTVPLGISLLALLYCVFLALVIM